MLGRVPGRFGVPDGVLARVLRGGFSRGNLNGTLNRRPPQKGFIEPSRRFSRTPKKVLSNPKRFNRTPFWAPKRFKRTLVRGTSEPQTGFYQTFRVEPPPLFRLPFQNSPYFLWKGMRSSTLASTPSSTPNFRSTLPSTLPSYFLGFPVSLFCSRPPGS